ncbi:MAG: 50S ribosomal protein L24 [Candidatus Methanomethyliales bacterium]|nr:50S ribosomal protein L24 [Candidatus Methanomethylicales archaeon]
MTSIKPKLQRKPAPLHLRRKNMRAPLSDELRERYGTRTAALRKGDTVLIVRGDYKGHEGKVSSIDLSKMRITVEGVTMKKTDGTTKPVPIKPSKVIITKLDLSDKKRKEIFESRLKRRESS